MSYLTLFVGLQSLVQTPVSCKLRFHGRICSPKRAENTRLQVLIQAPGVLRKFCCVHVRGALRRQLLGRPASARRPERAVRLQPALLQRRHDGCLPKSNARTQSGVLQAMNGKSAKGARP